MCMWCSTSESGRRPDALIIRMRSAWSLVRTQAIFVDFAASASPRFQDARKRLAGAQVQGNSNTRILSHRRDSGDKIGGVGCPAST